jgi:hypothetical protein
VECGLSLLHRRGEPISEFGEKGEVKEKRSS